MVSPYYILLRDPVLGLLLTAYYITATVNTWITHNPSWANLWLQIQLKKALLFKALFIFFSYLLRTTRRINGLAINWSVWENNESMLRASSFFFFMKTVCSLILKVNLLTGRNLNIFIAFEHSVYSCTIVRTSIVM